jgi:glycosyltransferase involved in cell wall biosynthesis
VTGPRVAFINGGILGLTAFAAYLRRFLPTQSWIHAEHIVLTEDLSLQERAIRRVMCQRMAGRSSNVDFMRFRAELHAGIQARRRLARHGANAFDVLHFHRQGTAYGSLGLMKRIPSIVSIDCTQTCAMQAAPQREHWTFAPNVRMDGAVFRRAAAIVAISRWAADDVRRMYPDVGTPIHVMPNPVLLEWFDRGWIDQRRARSAGGLKPRFLFIGGDFVRKGGHELLDVWRTGSFGARAELDIVTDWDVPGPLPPGVRRWPGIAAYTDAWRTRWAAADAFVMPTRNEAFGLVFQEAAAAGLPAIGPDLNAVPEIIRDGDSGLLVPPGDGAALGRAMETLIASPELRERMGRSGREAIDASASPVAYLEKLTGIIAGALKSVTIH